MAYFRLITENLHFPLEVIIDFIPSEAPYIYEIYVSSSTIKPSLLKNDYKFLLKHFFIKYDSPPDNVVFCLNAITDLEITVLVLQNKSKSYKLYSKFSKINQRSRLEGGIQ